MQHAAVVALVAAVAATVLAVAPSAGSVISAHVEFLICEATGGQDCEAILVTAEEEGGSPPSEEQAEYELPDEPTQQDYQDYLCATLDLGCESWDPDLGLACNDRSVVAVYEYYGDLFERDQDLLWAGMANLAGSMVYAGMQDLHVLRGLATAAERATYLQMAYPDMPMALINALADASAEELELFETTFVHMHKKIFMDLAWQHAAYQEGGIEEMRRLDEAGELPMGQLQDWEDIASGDPERVARGNQNLLYREQHDIIQEDYADMMDRHWPLGEAVMYVLGQVSPSPIPGGRSFNDVMGFVDVDSVDIPVCAPLGWPCTTVPVPYDADLPNIGHFDDRWEWITEDMLPSYLDWVDTGDYSELERHVRDRSQDFRFIPLEYDEGLGRCA